MLGRTLPGNREVVHHPWRMNGLFPKFLSWASNAGFGTFHRVKDVNDSLTPYDAPRNRFRGNWDLKFSVENPHLSLNIGSGRILKYPEQPFEESASSGPF